jgi:hypothetical protein
MFSYQTKLCVMRDSRKSVECATAVRVLNAGFPEALSGSAAADAAIVDDGSEPPTSSECRMVLHSE